MLWSVLAPRLPAMWGKATLAMVVSSTSMNAASATVAAISHGFTRGFHAACTAVARRAGRRAVSLEDWWRYLTKK